MRRSSSIFLASILASMTAILSAAARADELGDFAKNAIAACEKINTEKERLDKLKQASRTLDSNEKKEIGGKLDEVQVYITEIVKEVTDMVKHPPASPAELQQFRNNIETRVKVANMQIATHQRKLGLRPFGALPNVDCLKPRFGNCADTPAGPIPSVEVPPNHDTDFFQLRVKQCKDRYKARGAELKEQLIDCAACQGNRAHQQQNLAGLEAKIKELQTECEINPNSRR